MFDPHTDLRNTPYYTEQYYVMHGSGPLVGDASPIQPDSSD